MEIEIGIAAIIVSAIGLIVVFIIFLYTRKEHKTLKSLYDEKTKVHTPPANNGHQADYTNRSLQRKNRFMDGRQRTRPS